LTLFVIALAFAFISTHSIAAPAPEPAIPPGAEEAKAALEKSPRHGEMVDIIVPGLDKPIRTWIVYPERKDNAGVVVVIHEVYGLSDWARAVADQIAAEGFIAVAPDLISGLGPGGGGTDSVSSRDDVVKLVRTLTPDMTRQRLDAVTGLAVNLPASNGKVATIGFCWGGARSFEYAASREGLAAAVVYYGSSPDSATLAKVKAPVAGFYGGDDARVNATIEPAKAALAARRRRYEVNVYDGAGHGFLRQQSEREGANLAAAQKAWPKTVAFLREILEK
ncbi:MAG TPA: dienelactone hydrolase family protein, partial [Thermoanaerobaculia bacterium]